MSQNSTALKHATPFVLFGTLLTLFINQAPHNTFLALSSLFSVYTLVNYKEETYSFFKEHSLFFNLLATYGVLYTIINAYHFYQTPEGFSYAISRARWLIFSLTCIPALTILSHQHSEVYKLHLKRYIFPLLALLSLLVFYDSLTKVLYSEPSTSLLFKSNSTNLFGNRPGWTYNPIPFSKLAVFASFIFGFAFLHLKNTFYKYSSLFLSAGMLFTALLTQTRATWLGLLLISPIILWRIKTSRKMFIGALLLSSTLLILPSNKISTTFKDRALSFGNSKSFSTQNRLNQWRANLNLFKDNPLMGVGYAANRSQKLMKPYLRGFKVPQKFMHPHNEYIDTLVGMGLIAFLLFLGLLSYPLVYSASMALSRTSSPIIQDASSLCFSFLAFILSTAFFDKITSIEWSTILFTWGVIFFLSRYKKSSPKAAF